MEMIVAVAGPSGVGKNTVINHLVRMDPLLRYVQVYTTREPRGAADDKKHVSPEELQRLEKEGRVKIFEYHNALYGEPMGDIRDVQARGCVPIMDFSIAHTQEWLDLLMGSKPFVVYLLPESRATLRARLEKEGRDPTGERYISGLAELQAVKTGRYWGVIDISRINRDSEETARHLAPILRRKIEENARAASTC
jgi:guanylate kinase